MNYHTPVMLEECLQALQLHNHGIYVDATLGGGGHTEAMLLANPTIRVFAFDQDEDAIIQNQPLLAKYADRLLLIQDNYSRLRTRLALEKIKGIDGILFDLGISTHQIDVPERGFSFQLEGDLDMRMNRESGISAAEVLKTFSYEQLAQMFREFGEEPEAGKIARLIIKNRDTQPLQTTAELANLLDAAFPQNPKYMTKLKARIFQALRIYVNQELEHLETALSDSVNLLNPCGRIVVMSYHSLEDRVVKTIFRKEEKACTCPDIFPQCVCGKVSRLKLINRKPILPSTAEILQNSRARSAKLRIAEKKGDKCK
jgi:16S rRNA (cytosine1402-N4)-methyltransferase